jgi:hypothetical protein
VSDNSFDPIDERAIRAGVGLRSTPVTPGDSRIAHRRVVRRRVAARSAFALIAAAGVIIAVVVSTRDDPTRVYTPTPVTTSLGVTSTTSGATSTSAPPNPSQVPEAKNFPPLIVADNGGFRVTPTEATSLGLPSDARVAFRLRTCGWFVYGHGPYAAVRVGIAGGDCPTTTNAVALKLEVAQADPDLRRLDGVGTDGGHDVLLIGHVDLRAPPSLMFDVQTGESRSVPHDARSVAGGILIRPVSYPGYGLEYHALSGLACDPTLEPGIACTGKAIPAPPAVAGVQHYYVLPVLDPAGKRVAFVDIAEPAADKPALVLSDVKSGQEALRLSLPWPWHRPTFLDFDGRWAVVSREGLPPLVVDTKATTPTFYQVSNATGMVTFDR